MKRYTTVADYIDNSGSYKEPLLLLREIILSSGLEETVKWGAPVYTYSGKNLIGITTFKSYSGMWFFQGGLLKDKQKKLINAQEGITKALRQWRFENIEEIKNNSEIIRSYIDEAIEYQKQGKEIKPKRNKILIISDELLELFKTNKPLKYSYEALPLSKKREYSEYILTAKQEATKQKRLLKIVPMIMEGIGLNDKYR